MSTQVNTTKEQRRSKYKKREAKKGTYKWKAKRDLSMFTPSGEHPFAFIEGKEYNFEVIDMYGYETTSEYQQKHYITREFLKEHFEEVSA